MFASQTLLERQSEGFDIRDFSATRSFPHAFPNIVLKTAHCIDLARPWLTPYNYKDEPDIHGSARMCTGSKLGACVIGHMENGPLVSASEFELKGLFVVMYL